MVTPHGRTPAITDEITQRIADYVLGGAYAESAARACGLPLRTFERWLAKGRAADAWDPPEGTHEFAPPPRGKGTRCTECNATARAKVHEVPVRPDEVYWRFWRDIEHAKGEARVVREVQVATDNPLAWLRLGPGRHRGADDPGWTQRENDTIALPDDEDVEAMLREIAEEIGTSPEFVRQAAEAASARVMAKATVRRAR